ncbi:peptide/nickel transport system permease protein [Microbacterium testaceum]|uniref:dipeptide/oligopeptide/nickel ABC transporter permease/ATP-binding protein n=1 Tax=Microbacterium TaxID=33882 RepID=UPI0027814BBF|nr:MULTISPECIES: dipeptide/oligopeptide/nickel ABC transporter permease/ATP-binding protein [Microbacterium]MDQ1111626.1 peptide/nickel transport system permease protein [Microbacterium testaceum]MDR6097838.1 peptide/nickel transport system permease protein [Microbacterium sp. SORGH_AS_0454]
MSTALSPAPAVPTVRTRRARPRISVPLVLALLWIAIVVIGAIAAPLLTPYDPIKQDLANTLSLPTASHPLGTDGLGRDILSRLLHGGQVSLLGALLALAVAFVIGVPAGLTAGYFRGGRWDAISARIIDLLQSVPVIVILLTILAVTGKNVYTAMAVFGLIVSPVFFRLARDGAAATSAELYVDAAKVYGLRSPRIIARHVLPNVRNPLIVQATIVLSLALLTQAGLSYLGLASPPPAPSWGGSVADANTYINQQPWMLVPSGLVLVLTILAFTVVGDAVRDAIPGNAGTGRGVMVARTPLPAEATPVDQRGAMLSVLGLSAAAGATPLLTDVSFELRRGEILALVGESGSGKTMTAMSIIGLLPTGVEATAGRIVLDGDDLLTLPESELRHVRGRRIAYIGQEPMVSLDPAFSVAHQIDESLRLHRNLDRRARRDEVRRLLAQVKIADVERVARSFPHELSGGMAQRVCIAMALAAEPELLIADEPTTALDVTVQADILELLRELCRERTMAMIIVTHDFGVVADVADRAIVMLHGRIIENAAVEELFDHPSHEYTAGLLAANPAMRGDEHAVWYADEEASTR